MTSIRLLVQALLAGAAMAAGAEAPVCLWSQEPRQPSTPTTAAQNDCGSTHVGGNASPLFPLLQEAKQMIADMEKNVRDYSAVLVKRERLGDKLSDCQCTFLKIRHKPLSVFLHFLAPENSKGEEAIYVEGQNDNKILGHTTGITGKLVGTLALDPNGMIPMQGQRYPITEIGILNMTRRMAAFAEKNLHSFRGTVQVLRSVKVNDRDCTRIRIVHPVEHPEVRSFLVQVHIDNQLHMPIRYEAYAWLRKPDVEPELVEEYTYLQVKLNSGLTDADFDPRNPNYGFP